MRHTAGVTYLSMVIALVVILTSCHSKRNVVSGASSAVPWTTLYTSVDVDVTKPSEMNFGSRLTMENGKYIHMSMRFIGMEVAALYITEDSVFFADKYHKYLYAEPLGTLLGEDYKQLTLKDIQNIFLGRKLLPEAENAVIVPESFVETPVGPVASKLMVFSDTEQGQIKGEVTWKPSSAKWNEPNRKVNFKVPTKYRRITNENLRSILKVFSY